jgi:hypothetical protein
MTRVLVVAGDRVMSAVRGVNVVGDGGWHRVVFVTGVPRLRTWKVSGLRELRRMVSFHVRHLAILKWITIPFQSSITRPASFTQWRDYRDL